MITQLHMQVNPEKLRKARQRKLWLISDLANKSGVHRNTISKLENGRGGAYPQTIKDLAEALDVIPADLLQD